MDLPKRNVVTELQKYSIQKACRTLVIRTIFVCFSSDSVSYNSILFNNSKQIVLNIFLKELSERLTRNKYITNSLSKSCCMFCFKSKILLTMNI